MRAFKEWLSTQGYGAGSTREHLRRARAWCAWLGERGICPEHALAATALDYLDQRRQSGIGGGTLYHDARSISLYHRSLALADPCAGLQIRPAAAAVRDLPTAEERAALYARYRAEVRYRPRSLVVLGLLLFQGLRSSELTALTVEHIDSSAARVQIAECRNWAGRVLKLEAEQIADLVAWLSSHPGGRLFTCEVGSLLKELSARLRSYDGRITSARTIRAALIGDWIAGHGIRRAQHMAGHRSLQATVRYRRPDLAGLQAELMRRHPLKPED